MGVWTDSQEDGPIAGTRAMEQAQGTVLTRVQIPFLLAGVLVAVAAGWWPLLAVYLACWFGVIAYLRATKGYWCCGRWEPRVVLAFTVVAVAAQDWVALLVTGVLHAGR